MEVLLAVCLGVAILAAVLMIVGPRSWRTSQAQQREIKGPEDYDERASERLVGLIDLLFALVLTLPVLTSQSVIHTPWHSNVPAVLAIVLGYYVVVRSFIDWHIAMEDAPYWIRTSDKRSFELWRVYVDCLIVMAYVLLFLSAQSLGSHSNADIGEYLFVFAVIFGLYLAWGQLRRLSYQNQHEFRWQTLVTALIGFVAIWGAYRLDRDRVHWLSNHSDLSNVIALSLALGMYASYRLRNWREMSKRRAVARPTA